MRTIPAVVGAALLLQAGATRAAPSSAPASPPAVADAVARARQLLHQGQGRAALEQLEPALGLSASSSPDALQALVERDPVAATVLARAAHDVGRIELALPLYQRLQQRAALAGDRAVAARLAIRLGDLMLQGGHPAEAVAWYQQAQSDEVMLRATLGLARALRHLGQAEQALAAIQRTAPEALPLDAPLRAPLLAEGARAARAADRGDAATALLAELWAAHPADTLAVPGFPDDDDPLARADVTQVRLRAGALGEVQRAERLLDAGQLEQALLTARAVRTTDAALRCRAGYVEGKSLRNLRRHSQAARVLEPLAATCPEQAPRALYLLGMVLGFRGQSAQALAAYERFARRFPAHEYTDDVLFFAGDELSRRGHHVEAEQHYLRVVDLFPGGDYAAEARWRLAWGAYLDGRVALARERLDAIARAEAGAPDPRPYQQAVYWRARLGLLPGASSAPAGDDDDRGPGDEREAALDDLEALVRADPTSYHGVQARAILQRQAPARAAALDRWLIAQAQTFAQAAQQRVSAVVPDQPTVRLGHALAQAALDEEAAEVLATVDAGVLDMAGVLLVAEDLRLVGDTHAAHWLVRTRAERELVGRPDPEDAALWLAGYPQGYQDVVVRWARARGLDENLVFGLIREESAFDAPVVSWAGAVGLMQLMPYTARDQASLDRVTDFDLARLAEPELNVRLGSAHIARRIRTFAGNHALAIAAYNAGPKAVQKWVAAAPGAELDVVIESIPIEQTRRYTKRVLRSWAVYRFLYVPEAPVVDLAATAR